MRSRALGIGLGTAVTAINTLTVTKSPLRYALCVNVWDCRGP